MGKNIEKFGKAVGKISYFGSNIGSWGVFILMCFSVLSVILRKIGYPVAGSLNLTVFMLVAVSYISFAYAQSKGEHVAVDLLVSRLGGKARRVIIIIGLSITLAACSFLLWSGCRSAWLSLAAGERMDGAPYYPLYPSKIILGIGLILLWIQILADLLRSIFVRETDAKSPL